MLMAEHTADSGLVSLSSRVPSFFERAGRSYSGSRVATSDVGSFRSTLVMFVRIAFYATLLIATIGSRHYLLYDLQKEYIAVAATGTLTVVYGALGFFDAGWLFDSFRATHRCTVPHLLVGHSARYQRQYAGIARRLPRTLHCWRFRHCVACYSTRTQAKLRSIRGSNFSHLVLS